MKDKQSLHFNLKMAVQSRIQDSEYKVFEDYYVQQIRCNQRGRGMPYFKEYDPQKGGFASAALYPILYQYYLSRNNQNGAGWGSFFKSFIRTLIPVAKKVGKTLGKQAIHTGIDIARDVSLGHNWKEASEKRLEEAGDNLIGKTKAKVDQIMSGSGRKRRVLKKKVNKRANFSRKLFSLIGDPKRKHQNTKRRQTIDKWL